MIITIETTIKELYDQNIISTRTYNVLNQAQLKTITDIIQESKDLHFLLDIPGYGKKCQYEVENAINRIERIPSIINKKKKSTFLSEDFKDEIEIIFQHILQQYKDISNIILYRYNTGYALNISLLRNYEYVMLSLPEHPTYINKELRIAYLSFFQNVHLFFKV